MRICARSFSNRCGQEHGVDLSTPQGRFFNPGHSIEVAWFLLHMCEVVPDDALSELALNVLEGSLEMGWDERPYDLVDWEAEAKLGWWTRLWRAKWNLKPRGPTWLPE